MLSTTCIPIVTLFILVAQLSRNAFCKDGLLIITI